MKRLYLLSALAVLLSACKESARDIKSFVFNGLKPPLEATINDRTIQIKLPPTVAPTNLTPTISISDKAQITPASGITQDFTNSVTYVVTAENDRSAIFTTSLVRPDVSAKDSPTPPKYLCIYNGYPSLVNGSAGNLTAATNVFMKFDPIVFGNGLQSPSHPDYQNTKTIIANLKAKGIKVFGYISVGVLPPAPALSSAQLTAAIDAWQLMGVTGVFGDNFGYDFQVSRTRQNSFISYAHGKNLSVFVNSFYPEDALAGTDCLLDKAHGDYSLLESFLFGNGAYRSLDEFKRRGDSAYYYMKKRGVGIACLASTPANQATSTSNTSDAFKQSWYGTAMYNFDAYQFTDNNYSSTYSVLYFYQNPINSYGTNWKQFDWIKKASNTLYERETDTNLLYINGNGTSSGTGGHL